MKQRPSFLPALTLISLSIVSHFANADRNKGQVLIVTPECANAEACKTNGLFSKPFEEPLLTGGFPDQDNTNITSPLNNYPDNGKCEKNEDGVLKCKPAAGPRPLPEWVKLSPQPSYTWPDSRLQQGNDATWKIPVFCHQNKKVKFIQGGWQNVASL